jgi:hypothetical protein
MTTWPIDQATMLLAQVDPYAEQPEVTLKADFFWAALVPLFMGLPLSRTWNAETAANVWKDWS